MSESRNQTKELSRDQDDEVSFVDFMIVLVKYKKLILLIPAIMTFVAAVITFILPDIYKATTKLLPPQQAQSSASAILSQLGGVAGLAAGAAGLKSPNDLYVGMLKSRTVADKLIARFDLKKVYGTDSLDKARKTLEDNSAISSGKDGLISIDVEDKDKKLVAPLANAYVEELIALSRKLAVTEASQRRVFYERQLLDAKNNLANAERAIKSGLDTHGVISIDAESRAVLETVAKLKAQVSAKEVQLNSMKAFVTESHPEYRKTEEELAGLRGELAKLENGRVADAPKSSSSNGAAGDKSGFDNIQLLRDLKYYQMLYELLAKQYELARLDEAKDPAIIQVLDPAAEPERKFKPKRAFMLIVCGALSLVVAIIAAFVIEANRRAMRNPSHAARWLEFKSYLKNK
jgi:uncharacterized protein involved in exopolysaccharide biosynthesis